MPTAVAARAPDAPPPADGPPRAIARLRARPLETALGHRRDIDGLRAIAILLVVAYHAEVPGLSAGFIGVDVFFVISGFLITRLIVNEVDRTGSLNLGRFWLRRGRRLLPASALMVTSVLLAGQWLDSPLRWKTAALESFSALTYWSNHLFAARATDYFADPLNASPLLHTWSLAVEEQFYVLWPVVLFLTARFVTAGSRRAGAIRMAVVAVLTLGSFVVSLRLTELLPSEAFFTAPSRAWEFGAGALLAVSAVDALRLRALTRITLTATGVVALLAALTLITSETSFPGTSALLPVAATAALITARPDRGLGRLLGARPLGAIGKLSYSWYLWHWPFVVLGTQALGRDGVAIRVVLSVLALGPAELTRRLVENPIRHRAALERSTRASTALLVGITLVGTAVAGGVWWRADRVFADPVLAALDRARSDWVPVAGECSVTIPEVSLQGCSGGDPAGSQLIAVVGDSHGAHWIPAVDSASRALGLRSTASVHPNCPSIDVRVIGETAACERRQAGLPAMLAALDPEVVVVSHSVGYLGGLLDDGGARYAADGQPEAWRAAMARFARDLRDRGIGLVVILDIPRFEDDPLECAARARSVEACAGSGAEMRERLGAFHEAERAALTDAGHGVIFDPFTRLCGTQCPIVIDGEVVYTDGHHLTATFSRTFAEALSPSLRTASLS